MHHVHLQLNVDAPLYFYSKSHSFTTFCIITIFYFCSEDKKIGCLKINKSTLLFSIFHNKESEYRTFGHLWRRPTHSDWLCCKWIANDPIPQYRCVVSGEICIESKWRHGCLSTANHWPRKPGQKIAIPPTEVCFMNRANEMSEFTIISKYETLLAHRIAVVFPLVHMHQFLRL